MDGAPDTPDTFLGYPCRITNRFKGILHRGFIIDERWLLAMFERRHDTGLYKLGLYKLVLYSCEITNDGDPMDLVEVAEGDADDELGMFNWIRKQLEELDGKRT